MWLGEASSTLILDNQKMKKVHTPKLHCLFWKANKNGLYSVVRSTFRTLHVEKCSAFSDSDREMI